MPQVQQRKPAAMQHPKTQVQALAFPMPVAGRSRAFLALGVLVALVLTMLGHAPAKADTAEFDTPSKLPVPRWGMLRRNEVYARNGPSKDNTIVWTYKQASLPVQIISETHDWRLVCDPDGGVAWVSKTMIQSQKTVIAANNGQRVEMHVGPNAKSAVRAYLKSRSLAQIGNCKRDWCKISAGGQSGWALQAQLWGTQAAPVCHRPDVFARN